VWEFGLVNYRVTVGDIESLVPTGKARNRIDFVAEGRTWTLVDRLLGLEEHKHPQKVRNPQVSGTLSTTAREGEEWGDLTQAANDITRLLSFALCTWVPWASCSSLKSDGQRTPHVEQSFSGAAPYSSIRTRVAQHGDGVLRDFLESAYPRLTGKLQVFKKKQREAFDHAIGVYVTSQLSNDIIVRTSLLNMLLDALEDQFEHGHQIDKDLDRRLGEFDRVLHELLSLLSPNWTRETTNKVVNSIKNLNNRPPFPKAVKSAYRQLGIEGFEDLDFGARHALVHNAVLKLREEDKLPYLDSLDHLAFLMVAKLLGFRGPYHHNHNQGEVRRVENESLETTQEEG